MQRAPSALKALRCPTCRGDGKMEEKRDAGWKRDVIGKRKVTKTVHVACPECGGSGILLRRATYDRYCELAEACVNASSDAPHMAEALEKARQSFRVLSADNSQLGLEINYFARGALGNPQRKGRAVVFYGTVYKILHRPNDKDVMVQAHGTQQKVAAWSDDDIFAVVGDTVVVAGVMWGFSSEENPKGQSERLTEQETLPKVRAWYVEVVQKGTYDQRMRMTVTDNSRAPVGTALQESLPKKRKR